MTVKDKMHNIIDKQPDDSTYDEIMKELFFNRMIAKGIDDVEKGRVYTEDQVDREIKCVLYLDHPVCLIDRILTTSCGSRGRIRRDYQSLVIFASIGGSFKNMELNLTAAQLKFSQMIRGGCFLLLTPY